MSWDPRQYLAFAGHRLRPVLDLLARIPAEDPAFVVDLGCGAGNGTKILRQTWPNARMAAVDSSPEMLERARQESPDIEWSEGDIATWQPDTKVDVLFSNAALHWLDHHETLFPALLDHVKPGGYFAVQMPANFREPSHTMIEEVAHDGPWRAAIEPLINEPPTKEPGFYYELLAHRVQELDIWKIQYQQVVEGDDPVAEFTKGTWLPQFLEPLEEPQRSDFEAEYRRRLREAYPKQEDGKTIFPFNRLFMVATV